MTKNIGVADKIIRILLAAGIAVLYFTNQISGTLALILAVVAVVLLATSFINFCPIYFALGISTNKNKKP
ncbi:MAG: DUF2892 domain-containing protein [Bacteroidetes bacterium]|nr:DUF2892 domain-containing protein [Bacteroidota bacterium]